MINIPMNKISLHVNTGRTILMVLTALMSAMFIACERPKEDIVLRHVKDVVADATSDPMLKAEAVFYNPNSMHGKLKHINVEIFVNGKKAGIVKQDFKIKIPAKGEFSVPL